MCGRYVLYGPHSRLREYFDLQDCAAWVARYNIAPQSEILVVRDRPGVGRVGQLVRWGLIPRWARDASIGLKLKGQAIVSACVITTTPNALMAPIHDRMPVLLAVGQFEAWLDPAYRDVGALSQWLAPAPVAGMRAHPVSTRVSNARNEGPELLEPI